MFAPSPFLLKPASVSRVMLQVCAALIPGIAAYAWLIGPAILIQILIASCTALLAEAAILRLRGRPLGMFLTDGSALLTAWLIGLTFPPLAPWWLVAVGTLFAIVIAKHLYGGLGQNPFNPAMVGFAACIVAFPALMSQWPRLGLELGFAGQLDIIFGLAPALDSLAGATPLDALKTALRLADGEASVTSLLANPALFGYFAGRGWELVAAGYLLGGLWLLQRRLITWHIPVAFISAMVLIAGALWLFDSAQFANPLFHVFSGGTLIGAFFIATDPVSGCTTPRGKLIFGFGAGLLVYIIRVFGGYPDGVAFAILLMNLCAPVIDLLTRPAIFGMKDK
jgi:Na+-translocating ferredoxin:NAD+ oxidoreductase subunit D